MGDLFILNTRCQLTQTIREAFESAGLIVKVSEESGVTDENLRGAHGFTAICIFVNKKILPEQVEIIKENGNKLVLHCSAGFDNSPTSELKEAGVRVGEGPQLLPQLHRGVRPRADHGLGQEHPDVLRHDQEGGL